jgi:parallel beta-helix repeat protein
MGAKKSEKKFSDVYNSTYVLSGFIGQRKNFDTRIYPYSNMILNNEGANVIEVRIKDNAAVNSHLANCIKYEMNSIKISCKSADLLDVYNILHIQYPNVLSKEASKSWILNANLEINNGSNFFVNSTNTSWLKINSTGGLTHSIKVHGNLAIDRVKITGWDYEKNSYPTIDKNGTNPRSHILIDDGVGRTNIKNSEIAYLGYRKNSGLSYNTGIGSTINNNRIHDLWYGINSQGNLSDLTIENNRFYNNSIYGIYIHDGVHDVDIKNNKVYNNGRHGIICSTDCHNVTIGSNQIFNNTKQGILLSKNASNSMIKNNIVYNNTDQIAIYDYSINNQIYNNTISGGKVGIRLNSGSAHNHIYNNSLTNSIYGVNLRQGASDNIIEMNKITNASNTAIYVMDNTTSNNAFKDNFLFNNRKNEIEQNTLYSNKN